MMWNALVLANGNNPRNPVAKAGRSPWPCFAPVDHRRVVDFPLAALAGAMEAGRIGRILYAADEAAPPPLPGPWDPLQSSTDPIETVEAALQAFGAPLLVVRGDAALMRTDIILSFLDEAEGGKALSAALCRAEDAHVTPEAPARLGIPAQEGSVLFAGLFGVATTETSKAMELSRWAMKTARSTATQARTLAPRRLRPGLQSLAAKAERRFGLSVEWVEASDPAAAFRADRALDLVHLRKLAAGAAI